jgi:iron transport multicopper oxidase
LLTLPRRYIIETDGVDTEPYKVDNFPISVAQRYSVLVKARSDNTQNFALHANFDPQMFDAVPEDLQLSASFGQTRLRRAPADDADGRPLLLPLDYTATVTYDKNAPIVNEVLIDEYEFFDDMKMVPRLNFTMEPADIDVPMVFGFDTYDTGTNRAFFNEMCAPPPPSLAWLCL